mmetsp:Transcript_15069/g.39869  ORF Transcript_15069/g.39869 Transcript_15069/m.39869 type:complete len:248 (+) Transcript_15069:846-1589(+)
MSSMVSRLSLWSVCDVNLPPLTPRSMSPISSSVWSLSSCDNRVYPPTRFWASFLPSRNLARRVHGSRLAKLLNRPPSIHVLGRVANQNPRYLGVPRLVTTSSPSSGVPFHSRTWVTWMTPTKIVGSSSAAASAREADLARLARNLVRGLGEFSLAICSLSARHSLYRARERRDRSSRNTHGKTTLDQLEVPREAFFPRSSICGGTSSMRRSMPITLRRRWKRCPSARTNLVSGRWTCSHWTLPLVWP